MVEHISADELAARMDREGSFALVDTRGVESYEAWHAPGAHNFPFGPDAELTDERRRAFESIVGDTRPVVTICAKGVSSRHLADALVESGVVADDEVFVVEDGMRGWSNVYETTPVQVDEGVEVVQVQRRAKGCLGYLVGDPATAEAAVVDATRQTDVFREVAADAGYDIVRVLDTHVHADHLSGGRALADELDVPYHLGADARERGVEVEYDPLERNEVVEVGDIDLKALATPGHTTESVSYLVDATAVLTGDSLFVDSTGRTELEFGERGADEGARLLYDSLHRTLLAEPDAVTVLPGHVDVASDGEWGVASPGDPVAGSVGTLRTGLSLLERDREGFVDYFAEHTPEKPPNYERVVAVNRGIEAVPDEPAATELEMGPNNCAIE
ncbi:MBL fold metallo-hydrolase [Halospeciosus flavus]|uniref:Rhodanese-like domain-containing protein n=1 Tax=Halospeciosus flavus TaxID=3032283 RepID=A0ABD5Z0M5_9EURY|nr:rhodanese-like domain-containing protein [Halospeciosus flavus]